MQASELRVGNYYAFSKNAADGLIYEHAMETYGSGIFKVTSMSIYSGDIIDQSVLHYSVSTKSGGTCHSGVVLEYIEPIPLTDQILSDCGFEKDDTGVDIYDQDYHEWYQKDFPVIGILCQSSDKSYLFDENTDTLRIVYLHQLQNLYFTITNGKELEFKTATLQCIDVECSKK